VGAYLSCVEVPDRVAEWGDYLDDAEDDELVRNGWQYLNGASYRGNSYDRVAVTLRTLENYLGTETMARVMRTYHQRWRYRHPTLKDFIETVNEVSGRDIGWFFQQFFFGSNIADYAVTDIIKTPLEGKAGVYDEGGKKVTYSGEAAHEAFEKSKDKHYRTTVVVRRLGEAVAPVDIVVRFEDGGIAREHWDGQYRWVKHVYDRPVASAEVDPQIKLALDANFTNNSLMGPLLASGFSLDWFIDFSHHSPGSLDRYAEFILLVGFFSIPINTVLAGGVLGRFRDPDSAFPCSPSFRIRAGTPGG
jgi:hypothetical protein